MEDDMVYTSSNGLTYRDLGRTQIQIAPHFKR